MLLPGGAVSAVLDLAAVLLATGRDPSLSLVGEGWGAHVALAVAQWEPKLVAAMVGILPSTAKPLLCLPNDPTPHAGSLFARRSTMARCATGASRTRGASSRH